MPISIMELLTLVPDEVKTAAAAVAAVWATRATLRAIQESSAAAALGHRAAKKRSERDAKRDAFLNTHKDEANKDICNMTGQELQAAIASKTVTAADAMLALTSRAAHVGVALGSNADEMFEEAIAEAAALDKKGGSGKPLQGVGISIKDSLSVKGTDSTFGTACRTFKPAEEDSLLVHGKKNEKKRRNA